MLVHLFRTVLVVDRAKHEGSTLVISHNVASNFPFPSFEALIGQILKTEARGIVRCGLLGIADPEGEMR